jgi:hypothetical protein
MRKNLFESEPVRSGIKPVEWYDVNGKLYAIADSMNIKVQASVEDVQVYGWTLEVRWKHDGGWYQWMTYWNHRIYQTTILSCLNDHFDSSTNNQNKVNLICLKFLLNIFPVFQVRRNISLDKFFVLK